MLLATLLLVTSQPGQLDDPRIARAILSVEQFLDRARLVSRPYVFKATTVETLNEIVISVAGYGLYIYADTGVIWWVSNGAQIGRRSRTFEVRDPRFIRTEAENEPILRAMLVRLGVPSEWKTDALSLSFDESKEEGDLQDRCGVVRIVISERVGGLPFHVLDNSAQLEADPVTGDLLEFFVHRRCRAVPGVQRIEAARAKEIAVAEYARNRTHIPHAPETPLPQTPELGYCASQEHQRKPMAEWRDLPALLSWKVPFEDSVDSYVVVNAEDGSILWRSWLNLSRPPTTGNDRVEPGA